MIECKLAMLMAERKLRIADVIRETGIPRGTLTRLYNETAVRVDLSDIDKLCEFFDCTTQDLLPHTKNEGEEE